MINPKTNIQILFLTVFFAWTSLGAWWDFGKPKTEEPEKKARSEVKDSQVSSSSPNFVRKEKNKELGSSVAGLETELRINAPVPITSENIGQELTEIINRTSKLQEDVKVNRTEVLEIMERAKIHDRILKTIKIPEPVKLPVKTVDADAIVQQEKLRLIAQQTQQAQKQLETIQRTRALESQRTTAS